MYERQKKSKHDRENSCSDRERHKIMKKINVNEHHGICRTVDELGRLGFPKELREHLDIQARDKVEMIAGEDYIILKKHQETCVFCKECTENLISFKEKLVCVSCLEQLRRLTTEDCMQEA